MAKHSKKEIRVGVLIIAALAILILFVFSIGDDSSIFGGKVKYYIFFSSTAGLYEGDPVLLTGVDVGNVSSIRFPEDLEEKRIRVDIEVNKNAAKRIRQDTRARLASASIVYGKVVQLSVGSSQLPQVEEGGMIPVEEGRGLGAIVDSTSEVIDDVRSVFAKIDRGKGMLGMLVNEPMGLQETLRQLSASSTKLTTLLTRVEKGQGPLGTLFSDSVEFKSTIDGLKQATQDLGMAAENLKGNKSALGKLINDPVYGKKISEDLQLTMRSLASITAKIDSGKGTLGALVNDPEIYYGLQDVVLGIQNSGMSKWYIQNRRKAGEKARDEESM